MGNSTGNRPHCKKVIFDFNEIYSVCRAFNSKNFDRKILKNFRFHGVKPKILLPVKCQKRFFLQNFDQWFWIVFSSSKQDQK
jgi:hypothetical protein